MDEMLADNAPTIPFVDVATLDPEARTFHDRMAAQIGFVPNSIKTYLHRPDIAMAIMGLTASVYAPSEGGLPPRIKARLGAICSVTNGCAYCTSHQCNSLQNPSAFGGSATGLTDQEVAALVSGQDHGCDAVEQACFAYARAASLDPNSVSNQLLAEMNAVLTPAQIVELAAVVGTWKLLNCIHDSLHLPIEDAMLPYRHFIDSTG